MIERVVRVCRANGVERFYKKTDSTLRGNIGSECTSLLSNALCAELMFVPAFPEMGRTTVNGHQYVRGEPIHNTVFGADPLAPVTSSFIPDLIRGQASVEVVTVRSPEEADMQKNSGKRIVVFDASTDEDMVHIGRFLMKRGKLGCTAGCAGFAAVLSELLGWKGLAKGAQRIAAPFLVVCGSLHPQSVRQADYAEQRGMRGVHLSWEAATVDAFFRTADGNRIAGGLSELLRAGADVVVRVSHRSNTGPSERKVHARVARNLSDLVYRVACSGQIGTLVVFGGDTAAQILRRLGSTDLELAAELLPGVPLARTVRAGRPLDLITKAGGFGFEAILLQLRELADA